MSFLYIYIYPFIVIIDNLFKYYRIQLICMMKTLDYLVASRNMRFGKKYDKNIFVDDEHYYDIDL